jgi:hypothetical protein
MFSSKFPFRHVDPYPQCCHRQGIAPAHNEQAQRYNSPDHQSRRKIPHSLLFKGKRVVLASSSPRRKQIFEQFVCHFSSHFYCSHVKVTKIEMECNKGLQPEIIPFTFPETLPHGDFAANLEEYATSTAEEKVRFWDRVFCSLVITSPHAQEQALEVYERLVVR